MYLTVLIPVIDVRPLLAEPTYRDPLPGWPVPARRYSRRSSVHHRSSYVRGLGAVRPRRRGAIAPWLSESSYVDLRGQLRVDPTARIDEWQGATRVAYRNFYSDGITGRLEVCFAFRGWHYEGSRRTTGLMRKQALSAPAWMRGGDAWELRDFGPAFAEHLLNATTIGRPDAEWADYWSPSSWWVQTGALAIIEEFPRQPEPDDGYDADKTDGNPAVLRQHWEVSAGTRVSTWGIVQNAAAEDDVRRLRVHVCRLHTGFASAEAVLGLCHSGYVDPNRPEVERFLVHTLDVLLRPTRHGFSNADLLGQVIGHARDVYWDTMTVLRYALESLDNPRISGRVQELHDLVAGAMRPGQHQIAITVKELHVSNHQTHISGGTFSGPVSTGSGDAIQHNNAQADLPDVLARLRTALAELTPALDGEDAADAENAASGLEREAETAPEARTPGRIKSRLTSLLDIAQRAGESGSALAAAVTAVTAAFGV